MRVLRPPATVIGSDGTEIIPGRLVVRFRPATSELERISVHQLMSARGAVGAHKLRSIGRDVDLVDVTGATSPEQASALYRSDPRVESAEPDGMVYLTDVPNDPYLAYQWGLASLQAPAAWSTTHGSSSVYVAVIDSGIYDESSTFVAPDGAVGHPDLRGKVVARRDFVGAGYTDDDNGHGTHVAGIIAASTNNGIGVAGVGYNTRLFAAKACYSTGSCPTSAVLSATYWAADNGAKVINLSLGSPGACSASYQAAIDYAWARNVVVVVAAGNDGTSALQSPASCNHVLAVASTDSSDLKSSFSTYGSWVQVAAPGGHDAANHGILSTDWIGSYVYESGTSMAAPHVSAVAALVWAILPGSSASTVIQRIENSADPVSGTGTYWQYGRVDAARAVATPCATLGFSGNPASPQVPGTAVTFTATSACGTSTAQYKWWIQPPSGAWTMVQDWGASTFNWNTTGLAAGAYGIGAWVRAVGSGADYQDALGQGYTLTGTGSLTPCTTVGFSGSPASPQAPGAAVTFTATSACGTSTAEYQWWVQPPGGAWTMTHDWGASTFGWNTTGLASGSWNIGVWVRAVGSSAAYEDTLGQSYTLASGASTPCTTVGFSGSPASPQAPGTTVSFAATSVCGTSTAQYKWWVQPPGGAWTMTQDWGASTFSWNTAGLAAGVYNIGVWVRAVGSSAAYEDTLGQSYTLAGSLTPCTTVGFSGNPASPQAAGVAVTFTATSACGTSNPQYKWWVQPPGGAWTMTQDWGASTFSWNSTGLSAGTYNIGVWVRVVGSTAPYEDTLGQGYTLGGAVTPCSGVGFTGNPASPQATGTAVTFTATSACGTSTAHYKWWVQPPGGAWTMVQDWGVNTFSWNTTGLAAGAYNVGVWVRAVGSSADYQDALGLGYTLSP
jgi:thermitase